MHPMPQFGQITPLQTMRLIGTPDCPTIFDVRLAEDIDALPASIPGAVFLPYERFSDFPTPPGSAIVVCMKGRKLSEGVAALLRTKGWKAEILAGGAAAWAEAGLSRMFRDDLQQLEVGMTLYDALYRWARDGFEEGHESPSWRAE
jgi:rhodanese-related sulfurtransferase